MSQPWLAWINPCPDFRERQYSSTLTHHFRLGPENRWVCRKRRMAMICLWWKKQHHYVYTSNHTVLLDYLSRYMAVNSNSKRQQKRTNQPHKKKKLLTQKIALAIFPKPMVSEGLISVAGCSHESKSVQTDTAGCLSRVTAPELISAMLAVSKLWEGCSDVYLTEWVTQLLYRDAFSESHSYSSQQYISNVPLRFVSWVWQGYC